MIDFHTHTTASDGGLSPEALVGAAAAAGLTAVAITDHDTVAGVPAAIEAGRRHGVTVVAGVELSAQRPGGGSLHVLGYHIDPGHPALRFAVEFALRARCERNRVLLRRLARRGYTIDAATLAPGVPEGSVGRVHVARALVQAGHFCTVAEAFRWALGEHRWAYVDRLRLAPKVVFDAIRAAGGVAVLAHPGRLPGFDATRLKAFLGALREGGLGGVEVHHPAHSRQERERFEGLAAGLGLAVTGGSDFHGPDHTNERGLGRGAGGEPIDVRYALASPGDRAP